MSQMVTQLLGRKAGPGPDCDWPSHFTRDTEGRAAFATIEAVWIGTTWMLPSRSEVPLAILRDMHGVMSQPLPIEWLIVLSR